MRGLIIYSQAVHIEENVALAPLTTLQVGGPARYLVRVTSEAELLEAVDFARGRGLPIFVLGGGSNLVVSDRGFDGVVLQIAIDGPMNVHEHEGITSFTVPAGKDWDAFVLDISNRGLSGVECLAGIPGLVGGTPVQNVGAYGQDVAETILAVRAFDLHAVRFVELRAAECAFEYRRSIFNSTARGRYVVTSVQFQFKIGQAVELKYAELTKQFAGKVATPLEVYKAVRRIRQGKGMLLVDGDLDCRSAGSFFKNPSVEEAAFSEIINGLDLEAQRVPHWPTEDGRVKLAAAWLVEQAGLHKGFAMGRAGISSRHTLALVNLGGATAGELLALRDEVRRRVKDRFGVELEQEPVVLGD